MDSELKVFLDDNSELMTEPKHCEAIGLIKRQVILNIELADKFQFLTNSIYAPNPTLGLNHSLFSTPQIIAPLCIKTDGLWTITENVSKYPVTILSLKNKKLIVGTSEKKALLVFDVEKNCILQTIDAPQNLRDATWLSSGNILCTLANDQVVILTELGEIFKWSKHKFSDIQYMSVSVIDGREIICLASGKHGVFQSTDDGMTWSLRYEPKRGWSSIQAIRVRDIGECYFSIEMQSESWRLCKYGERCKYFMAGQYPNKTIVEETVIDRETYLSVVRLEYDGEKTLYLSVYYNHCVQIYSINGDKLYTLSPNEHNLILTYPTSLYFDRQQKILYSGSKNGSIFHTKTSKKDKKFF